jgi:nitrogen-specific signal transduction histidine kinase
VILSHNPTKWRLCERSSSLPERDFAKASSGTTNSGANTGKVAKDRESHGGDALAAVVDRPKELTIVTRPRSEGVQVEVKDNGIGIEKEKLESIFQPFYTTKPTGMGMGLSISRSIIKEHAGQLIAQPNDGPGTTFWFTLT